MLVPKDILSGVSSDHNMSDDLLFSCSVRKSLVQLLAILLSFLMIAIRQPVRSLYAGKVKRKYLALR